MIDAGLNKKGAIWRSGQNISQLRISYIKYCNQNMFATYTILM